MSSIKIITKLHDNTYSKSPTEKKLESLFKSNYVHTFKSAKLWKHTASTMVIEATVFVFVYGVHWVLLQSSSAA